MAQNSSSFSYPLKSKSTENSPVASISFQYKKRKREIRGKRLKKFRQVLIFSNSRKLLIIHARYLRLFLKIPVSRSLEATLVPLLILDRVARVARSSFATRVTPAVSHRLWKSRAHLVQRLLYAAYERTNDRFTVTTTRQHGAWRGNGTQAIAKFHGTSVRARSRILNEMNSFLREIFLIFLFYLWLWTFFLSFLEVLS